MKCVRPNVVRTPCNPPLHVSSTGNVTLLSFHIYLRTELFSSQYSRFQINSQVAAARLNISGQNVVELGNERVTSIFRVHQVYVQNFLNLGKHTLWLRLHNNDHEQEICFFATTNKCQ